MPPRKHALLSASGSERWLNCTPSAVLESKIKTTSSSAADEGTVAHALAELELKKYFELIDAVAYKHQFKEMEQTEYYDDTMYEFISEYVTFIIDKYNGYKNPAIFLEQHLDLSEYVPGGFGTSDVNIVSQKTLEVIDLKYGKGVRVEAEENRQLMLYALGAYMEFSFMTDIKKIVITVYQPRIQNFSSWELTADELLAWGEEELKPKAQLAYKGAGDFEAGEWCRFCKVKATCRAFAAAQLELAKVEFSDLKAGNAKPKDQSRLTDKEIALILQRSLMFKQWLTAIETYALDQAVNHGKKWPDMKLVAGRSTRRFTDADKVQKLLIKKGYAEEEITETHLIALGKIEKLLTPGIFNKLLNKLVIKPDGALTLVHKSDKRPEHNSAEKAAEDFKTK